MLSLTELQRLRAEDANIALRTSGATRRGLVRFRTIDE
jgi:hypothetical protein